MLTNHFLLPYKDRKKSISEFEQNLLNQDENYRLNLERPMETNQIKNIKKNIIHSFIDDIMCNNQVNTLLYSSTAKKELSFYLKQKKTLLKVVPLKNGIGYLGGGGKKTVKSFSDKQRLEKMYENIKNHIENYKINKNKSMILLQNKNEEFINSQPKIEKKLSKLYYKSINEIRLKGYQKALNKCLNLSACGKKFNMPDVELNKDNVYSRLYNNYILNFKKLKEKNKNSRNSSAYINRNNNNYYDNNTNNVIYSYKSINNNSIKSPRKSLNKRRPDSMVRHNSKKIIKFKLKSNISENENNKQFTIWITPNLVKKCWKSTSGGPIYDNNNKSSNRSNRSHLNKEEEIKNNDNLNLKEKFNYTILSEINNNREKNDISLFNTMIINDPNLKNIWIKNKNYRDMENNSNLYIAVKNNSIELVKYFLSKNYNLNNVNEKGQTALHLACELGNEEIINLLVEKGANVDIKDNKGKKPFDILSKNSKH